MLTHREPRKELAVSTDDSEPQKKQRKNPNWPNLLMRMQWATERTVAMGLNGVESSILKHVCFVDGIGEGCFQNQQTMVKETGWNHSTISRALASLTEKGLLERKRRKLGMTTKYCLLGLATMGIAEGDSAAIDSAESDAVQRTERCIDSAESDAVQRTERQQNPERNQEELTLNSSPELLRRDELKNISGTGDQDDLQDQDQDAPDVTDDQWKAPLELPNLFRNGITYAKFQGAFHSGELTRNWAHEESLHGGGMSPQETWAFEEWFDRTHPRTKAGDYEKLLADNIRRYEEEHGPAPVEAA